MESLFDPGHLRQHFHQEREKENQKRERYISKSPSDV